MTSDRSDLVEKYRKNNSTVSSLVKSYQASVNDPDNELVHLYEIRDALSEKFWVWGTGLRDVHKNIRLAPPLSSQVSPSIYHPPNDWFRSNASVLNPYRHSVPRRFSGELHQDSQFSFFYAGKYSIKR
jgi:hypothetical protein